MTQASIRSTMNPSSGVWRAISLFVGETSMRNAVNMGASTFAVSSNVCLPEISELACRSPSETGRCVSFPASACALLRASVIACRRYLRCSFSFFGDSFRCFRSTNLRASSEASHCAPRAALAFAEVMWMGDHCDCCSNCLPRDTRADSNLASSCCKRAASG